MVGMNEKIPPPSYPTILLKKSCKKNSQQVET